MADQQIRVDLTFGADTSKAKAQIKDLQNALQEVAKMPGKGTSLFDDKEIRQASKAAQELELHLSRAVNVNTGKLDLSRFSSSIKAAGKDLNTYYSQLMKCGPEGQKAFTQMAKAVATAETPVTRMNAKMSDFLHTMKQTVKYQISGSIFRSVVGSIQSAYEYAQDLNESLNNIRIVTGQSSEQMAKFAKEANKAAKELSTTTTAYTDASLIFYQQGLTGDAVKERASTVMKLANVTKDSAEDVSSYMTAVWNNFNDGSESLEHYADVITALGASTASSSAEIAEGLEKFASVGKTIGLSYDYATSALAAVVANTRQSADTVGTAFKTLFSRLQGLSLGETLDDGVNLNKYSKALATVGVQILDVNGQMKDADKILDETAEKWNNLSNAQQTALAQTVAGTRQYSQFVALMESWDDVQKNLQTAGNAEGTLQKQQDIYAESWEAAMDRVKASAQGLYDALIDDDFFISLTDGFSKVIDVFKGFVDGLGGMQGLLMTFGSIFLQIYANKMPAALNNIKENFMVITGQAKTNMQDMQKANDEYLKGVVNDDGSKYDLNFRTRVQGLAMLNEMQQKYVENANKMTDAEKQQYESKIKNIQAINEEIDVMARETEVYENKMKEYQNDAVYESDMVQAAYAIDDAVRKKRNMTSKMPEPQSYAQGENDVEFKEASNKFNKALVEQDELINKLKFDFKEAYGEAYSSGGKVREGINEQVNSYKELDLKLQRIKSFNGEISSQAAEWQKNSKEISGNAKKFDELKSKMKDFLTQEKEAAKGKGLNEMANAIEKKLQDLNNLKPDGLDAFLDGFKNDFAETSNGIDKLEANLNELKTALSASIGVENADALLDNYEELNRRITEIEEALRRTQQEASKPIKVEFSGAATFSQFAAAAMSAYTAINSLKNVFDTFGEIAKGNKSILDGVGATLSFLTAATSAYTGVKGLMNKLEESSILISAKSIVTNAAKVGAEEALAAAEGGTTAATIAQTIANIALQASMPPLLIVTLALVAALVILAATIMAIVAAVQAFQNASPAAELQNAKEAANEAADAAERLSQKYEELKNSLNDLDDGIEKISELKRGTLEWRQAIAESNQSLIDLLNTYGQLNADSFTTDEDGLMHLTVNARESMLSSSASLATKAINASNAEKIRVNDLEVRNNAANKLGALETGRAAADVGIGQAANLFLPGIAAIIGTVKSISDTANRGQVNADIGTAIGEALNKNKIKFEDLQNGSDDLINVLKENAKLSDAEARTIADQIKSNENLQKSLVELSGEVAANTEANRILNNQIVETNFGEDIDKAGLNTDEAEKATDMMGAALKKKTDELYERVWKDQVGGKWDEDIQRQYAKAMGYAVDTIENQNDNKAKYYNKDGSEVGVISDETARRFLAQQQAIKELGNDVGEYIKITKNLIKTGDEISEGVGDALLSFAGGNGGDLSSLTSSQIKCLNDNVLEESLSIDKAQAQALGYESVQAYYDSIQAAIEDYEKKEKNLGNEFIYKYVKNLATDLDKYNDLTLEAKESVLNVFKKSFANAGNEQLDEVSKIFKTLTDNNVDLEKFSNLVGSLDWNNANLEELSESFEDAGIPLKNFGINIDDLQFIFKSRNPTVEETREKFNAIFETLEDFNVGDALKIDEYNSLADSLGSDFMDSYFAVMEDGTYKLIGDAKQFYDAIVSKQKEQLLQGIADTKENLVKVSEFQNKYQDKDIYKKINDSLVEKSLIDSDNNIANYIKSTGLEIDADTVAKAKEELKSISSYDISVLKGIVEDVERRQEEGEDFSEKDLDSEDYSYAKTILAVNDALKKATEDGNSYATELTKDVKKVAQMQIDFLKTQDLSEDDAAKVQTAEKTFKEVKYIDLEAAKALDEVKQKYIVDTENENSLLDEESEKLYAQSEAYLTGAKNLEELEARKKDLVGQDIDSSIIDEGMNAALISLGSQYDNAALAVSQFQDALLTGNEALIKSAQDTLEAEIKIGEAAKNYGIDAQIASTQAKLLGQQMNISAKAAAELAVAEQRCQKAVNNLSSDWEDWSKVLKTSNKSSYEYAEALSNTNECLKDLLAISGDVAIPLSLFDSETEEGAHNLDLMGEAAKGNQKAIEELGFAYAEAAFSEMNFLEGGDVSQGDFLSAQDNIIAKIRELKGAIDELDNGKTIADVLGGQDDVNSFVNNLNLMAENTRMSVDEMQGYLNSMHMSADVDVNYVQVESKKPITVTRTREIEPYKASDGTEYSQTESYSYVDRYESVPETIGVATINDTASVNYTGSHASAPTGGNKGSGGSSKKKDHKKKKENAKKDPYYEVNQDLTKTAHELEMLQKNETHVYGPELIKNLEKQNKLLQDQVKLQQKKAKIAQNELSKTKSKLSDKDYLNKKYNIKTEVQFDKDGHIDNEFALRKEARDNYNKELKYYESLSAADQDKYKNTVNQYGQTKLQVLEEQEKNFLELLNKYVDDTDTYFEAQEAALEAKLAAIENNFEAFNLKFQVVVDKEQAEIELRNWIREISKDFRNAFSIGVGEDLASIEDYEKNSNNYEVQINEKVAERDALIKALKKAAPIEEENANIRLRQQTQESIDKKQKELEELKKKPKKNKDKIEKKEKEISNLESTLNDAQKEAKEKGYGDEEKKSYFDTKNALFSSLTEADEKIKQTQAELQDIITNAADNVKEAWDYYLNMIADSQSIFDSISDDFEKINSELDHTEKIIELIHGDNAESRKKKSQILDTKLNTAKEKEKTDNELYAEAAAKEQKMKEAYGDEYYNKQDWIDQHNLVNNLHNALMEDQKNIAQVISDIYENNAQMAVDKFQESIYGKAYDTIKQQWDLLKDQEEDHYDEVERSYKISAFKEKGKEIAEGTKNLKLQQKINEAVEYQAKLLAEKEQLTEKDVEVAERKLDVMKAEIALQEAMENKNSMKLVRDESGNWTYNYVADEEDIDKKKQEVSDANFNLYEATKGAYNSSVERGQKLQENYETTMTDLSSKLAKGEITQDEYDNMSGIATKTYNEGMSAVRQDVGMYQDQMGNAASLLEKSIYDLDPENYQYLSEGHKQLIDEIINYGIDAIDFFNGEGGVYPQITQGGKDFLEATLPTFESWITESIKNCGNLEEASSQFVTTLGEAVTNYKTSITEAGLDTYWNNLDTILKNCGIDTDDLNKKVKDFTAKQEALDCVRETCSKIKKQVDKISKNFEDSTGKVKELEDEIDKLIKKINNIKDKTVTITTKQVTQNVTSGGGYSYTGGSGSGSDSSSSSDGSIKKASDAGPKTYNIASIKPDGKGNYIVTSSSGKSKSISPGDKDNGGSTFASIYTQYSNIAKYSTSSAKDYLNQRKIAFDTGGYTGDWDGGDGRLAMLHSKEIVLNKDDTKNFLEGINTLREITSLNDSITSAIANGIAKMVGDLAGVGSFGLPQTKQEAPAAAHTFNITAEFPNASNVAEIQEAILSLPTLASQYLSQERIKGL